VPYGSTLAQSGKVNVRSFALRNRIRSAKLAGASFVKGEWLGGVDTQGNIYTTVNSPTYSSVNYDTNDLGIAGPRVGYTAAANYIAGAAFENPSTMRRVITAHSDDGTETVKLWNVEAGEYVSETLLTKPTTEARIIRPYAPVNGRVDMIGYNNMRDYGTTYTEYEGDWSLIIG
jgi:hypothetical protein